MAKSITKAKSNEIWISQNDLSYMRLGLGVVINGMTVYLEEAYPR